MIDMLWPVIAGVSLFVAAVQTYRHGELRDAAIRATNWLNRDGSLADGPVARQSMRELREIAWPKDRLNELD